jgi:hypothetical protein
VGATAFGEQKRFVDAAIRAGVKRFLPSEFSANSQNEAVLQLLPLLRLKKELVEYLKSKENEGLTWTGIATSGLFDWVSYSAISNICARVSNPLFLNRDLRTVSSNSTLRITLRLSGMMATRASPLPTRSNYVRLSFLSCSIPRKPEISISTSPRLKLPRTKSSLL